MALAELRRRIPVQLQSHRQRGLRVRTQRAIAGADVAVSVMPHPHRMVITARQQRSPRRRTQRCRVETVIQQTARGKPVRRRRTTRTTERARGAEADIIQQDDQDVRRTLRRQQWLDRREGGIRVLGVIGRQTRRRAVRDGQHRACMSVRTHGFLGRLEDSAAPVATSSHYGGRGGPGDPLRETDRTNRPATVTVAQTCHSGSWLRLTRLG